ncbi:MAG: YlbF family regulator [Clostridiales bacterium]|nr:YlbF family regulator [Clostridiales bacterium]
MEAEEKENCLFPDTEKILEKTEELTAMICRSDSYQRYIRHLDALKAQPDVYRELNRFRRENIELQMADDSEEYYEKTEELQLRFKNVLMEPVVMDYLASEQKICRIMRDIYDKMAQEVYLDLSYMDE